MKLLKIKILLHEGTMLFSIGMALVMLMETTNNLYPDVFCYIAAGISLINTLYSAWLLVDSRMELEEMLERERR